MKQWSVSACAGLAALAAPAPALASGWDMALVTGTGFSTTQSCLAAANAGLDEFHRTYMQIDDRSTGSQSVFAYEIGRRNGLDAVLFCISRNGGGYDLAVAMHADDGRESETTAAMDRLLEILER